MAIDTEEKRRSALTILTVPPTADNLIDGGDERHLAWIYAGIATGPPPVGSGGPAVSLPTLGGGAQFGDARLDTAMGGT